MIAQTPDGLNADIAADAGQLFPQKAHVNLHMVFHGLRIIAPNSCKDHFLRKITGARLEQIPHYVKLPGREPHRSISAHQRTGGKIQGRVAEHHFIYLPTLARGESDLEGLTLRYITHRLQNNEIRQNYYFFARLKNKRELSSTEGNLKCVAFGDIPALEMPVSAKHMILHYLMVGRYNNALYAGITEAEGTRFTEMKEFD